MDKQIKLEIEELEERIAPATLLVFPKGGSPSAEGLPVTSGQEIAAPITLTVPGGVGQGFGAQITQ